MGVVDWTQIAADLTMVNERVLRVHVHIYLSPPTRYTCLVCPTVCVVDSIHIHCIHGPAQYKDGKPRFVSAVSSSEYPATGTATFDTVIA
jgi:hypothetical protein